MLHGYRELHSIHQNRRDLSEIAKDVEARFDNLNYELRILLPR